MKKYLLSIHTQQGTVAYEVQVPEDTNLATLLLDDDPLALETTEGSTLIVQPINAVAIEVAEVDTPPGGGRADPRP